MAVSSRLYAMASNAILPKSMANWSQTYSPDTRYNSPVGTWRPRNVSWRSPKGPNVRDLHGTLRGPTKKLMSWLKKCFLDAIVFVLHIYYCFLLEKQIFKSSKWGRLRDPVAERLGNQMMERSGDFGHICF